MEAILGAGKYTTGRIIAYSKLFRHIKFVQDQMKGIKVLD
jgi:hypothetical protein